MIKQAIQKIKFIVLGVSLICGIASGKIVTGGIMAQTFLASLDSTDTGIIPVIVEAESGILGDYFQTQTDGDIIYITTTVNTTGTTPDDVGRVATLNIDFEDSGDYNLFARVRVGTGSFDDDSFFYGSDFGEKDATSADDWMLVNGLGTAGFSAESDWVDGPGSVGTETWKWVNLTKNGYQATAGLPFSVESDNLSRILQIATREDGLDIDKFVFGKSDLYFTVNDLDNVLPGSDSMGGSGDPTDPIDPIYRDSVYVNPNFAYIDFSTIHQKIQGFGAATPWYLAAATDSEMESAFGMDDGEIGLTVFRLTIDPDNSNWSKWVPSAKKAHEMGAKIIASPWHAPTNMRETLPEDYRVKPSMYADYAKHLNSFVKYMADNGAPIYGVSVQNEPDIGDWTQWTINEMLTFVRDYGHLIEGTKLMAPESFNFKRAYGDPILNDATACENMDIMIGHIYGAGLYKYPLAEEKGKEVWMTEYLMGENASGNNIGWMLDVAENINDVMKADMNAYVWWTMIRYYGPIGDGTTASNPEDPNDVFPAKGEVTKKGFAMSQFARFIRPGYYRISSQDIRNQYVSASAYKDSASSEVVVVAINSAPFNITQTFDLQNGSVNGFTSYVTSPYKNCELDDDVVVSNDSLTVTLEGYSVTTFVSNGPIDITSAIEDPSVKPGSFKLCQNYPNPFNPVTRIQYFLAGNEHVTLKVYNILGKEVATLVNEPKQAGSYTIHFDASELSNGIYFYQLKAGEFVGTKKFTLLK